MLDTVRLIELPKIADYRGNLTFVESERHLPFKIRRVYWLYDIPGGVERGGHAHKEDCELLVALSGSFQVQICDGFKHKSFMLKNPNFGLYLPTMVWRELYDFSSGSVCLVMASNPYDEQDYYRDFKNYQAVMTQRSDYTAKPCLLSNH